MMAQWLLFGTWCCVCAPGERMEASLGKHKYFNSLSHFSNFLGILFNIKIKTSVRVV